MTTEAQKILQGALKMGYLVEGEAQECLKDYLDLQNMGYEKSLWDVVEAKELLTPYQIERIKEFLQGALTTSPDHLTPLQTQKASISLGETLVSSAKKKSDPLVIPGYKIEKKLGQGGMGTVFLALQTSLDRKVAIKILSPELVRERKYVERLGREAKSLARLNHPNIVSAYDFGCHEGIYYLVMEYVEGKSLDEFLKVGKIFAEKEALEIMLQATSALEEAHGNHMIHRDIKPANLMCDVGGKIKLCDLGLAKETAMNAQQAEVTTTTASIGTPAYMSPEQARGEKDLSIQTDIYSLGATLYHLVTGFPPFRSPGIGGLYAKILSDEVPNPRKDNPKVSPAMARLILQMMAKDSSRRPQTPEELKKAIQTVQKGKILRSPNPKLGGLTSSRLPKTKGAKERTKERPKGGFSPGPAPSSTNKILIPLGVAGAVILFFMVFFIQTTPKKISKKKKLSPHNQNNLPLDEGSPPIHPPAGPATPPDKPDKSDHGSGGSGSTDQGSTNPPETTPKNPTVKNLNRQKLIQKLASQIQPALQKKEYTKVLKLTSSFWQKYNSQSWFDKVEKKINHWEEAIYLDFQKEDGKLFQKTSLVALKARGDFYKKMTSMGTSFFQEKIEELRGKIEKQFVQLYQQKKALVKFIPAMKDFMITLRVWEFKKAQEIIQPFLDMKFSKEWQKKVQLFAKLLEEGKRGVRWINKFIFNLAMKKRPLKMSTFFPGEPVNFRWSPGLHVLYLCGKKSGKMGVIMLPFHLKIVRLWIQKQYPKKARELKKLSLFLMMSGDVEGAKKFIPVEYKPIFKNEIKKRYQSNGGRLVYTAGICGKSGKFFYAREALRTLKKGYPKFSHFNPKHPFHKKFSRWALGIFQKYYRLPGTSRLFRTRVKTLGQGKVKITYDFSKTNAWRDWKAVNKFYPSSTVAFHKKYLILRGQARIPIEFRGDLRVEIEAQSLQSGPSTVGIIGEKISDSGSPLWLVGFNLTLPGYSKIPLYTMPTPLSFVAKKVHGLPASGVVFFAAGAPRPVLLKNRNPRFSRYSHYTISFVRQGDRMSANLGKSSYSFSFKNPKLFDRGGALSLYTGRCKIAFSKITLVGTLDESTLTKRREEKIHREFLWFIKQ